MDSDNILSILQSLNGGGAGQDPSQAPAPPATNVLQAAAPAPAAPPPPQAAPAPVYQDPTAQIAQAATAASPPMPHQRSSLVNILGRISDVLATVGGAHPLYQPTLDAETARDTAAQNQALAAQKANIDLATGKFDLSDKQREAGNDERSRFASVLDAVNDPEDAANLPAMMAAAGLTDARYAPFVKMVQDNPDVAKTLSGALGGGDAGTTAGKQIKFGYDSTGKRVAFTVDSDGNSHILQGVTPDEHLTTVDAGGSTPVLGPNGQPITVIPHTEKPGMRGGVPINEKPGFSGGVPINEKPGFSGGRPIAPAPGKGTANVANTSADALSALDNIQGGFDRLHTMGALAGDPNTPAATLEGAFGRTALGQRIGAQFGNKAAQERLALQKNLSNLQSYMISSLPGSATRTKFEQEIQKQRLPDPMQMDYPTATRVIKELRQSYQRALSGANAEVSAKAPKSTLPAGWENAPTVSPADAAKLPSGAKFISLDGRALTRP